MTNTPDKESNTTMDRTAGRLRSTNLGMAGHCISDDSGRLIAVAQTADSAERIVTACNAFETMREALAEIAALPDRDAFIEAVGIAHAALSTLPVNDRPDHEGH